MSYAVDLLRQEAESPLVPGWRIARTDGHELHIMQLTEFTLRKLNKRSFVLFPVVFATYEEAQAATDFIERIVDKALATIVLSQAKEGNICLS